MNLISRGPYQPPQAQVPVGMCSRYRRVSSSTAIPSPSLMGKVRLTQMCQHQPWSELCVAAWTQPE